MVPSFRLENPHSVAKRGERAQGKVGEPEKEASGIPEGIPTEARSLEGACKGNRTKKSRQAADVRLTLFRSPNPVASFFATFLG